MTGDPYARKVYLQPLPDTRLSARHSSGTRLRAAQLQHFLCGLHEVACKQLEPSGSLELLVVHRRDWRALFSYPYGLPFTRTRAGQVSVVAAADYPPRLIARWDAILLRAARAGLRPPGELREFLDLLVGHEWGHAAANLAGLRTRVRWFDEFLATYLFLSALHETASGPEVAARFVAWAQVQVAGSATERADLGAFEYPRVKLPFDNLLWFQGTFTLYAAELHARHGWAFVHELRCRLESPTRPELARALLAVEPGFKNWFAHFGDAPT